MTRFALPVLLLAAACGDGDHNNNADAGVDAPGPMPTAIVVSGDFDAAGIMSKLDVTTLAVTQNVATAGAVGADPLVRHDGNRLYVINRVGANNITMLDGQTLAFMDQWSTGENSNPQDVAVVGNNLYVPALATTGMVKINILDGTTETIDLGTEIGDTDGNPDCVSAYAVDTRVFVACDILDENYTPRGNGKVAIYDTNSGHIDVLDMPAPNPQNFFTRAPANSAFGSDLLIPLVPSFTDYSTGCIARVSTGNVPAVTCASTLTNSAIAGFAAHLDVSADASTLWMAVSTLDQSFMNPTGTLKAVDLSTGMLRAGIASPSSQMITDVAACPDGSVVAVDHTMDASGLRVYGSDGVERTTAALGFGLPPAFGNNTVCYDL